MGFYAIMQLLSTRPVMAAGSGLHLGYGALSRGPAPSNEIDGGFERRDIGAGGIERAAAPCEHRVVFVALRAAAVFGRAAASLCRVQLWHRKPR